MNFRRRAAMSTIVALGVSLLVAVFWLLTERPHPHLLESGYQPSYSTPEGEEVLVVVMGSSQCRACFSPGFVENVQHIIRLYSRKAHQDSASFAVLGVALDWEVAEGIAFLERFGMFDEVSVGRNWANSLVQRYVWDDLPGRPAIPQILVVRRYLQAGDAGIAVENESLVRRIIGTHEIRREAEYALGES